MILINHCHRFFNLFENKEQIVIDVDILCSSK